MYQDIRLLLVEDEKDVRNEYKAALMNHPTVRLVAEVETSAEAYRILQEMEVDAIILDLELREGSGMLLLQRMQSENIRKPFIAAVTNVVSKVVYDSIRSMGVDYICTKSANFSWDVPLSIIEISAPYRRVGEESEEIARKINARTKLNAISRSLNYELIRMGFSEKLNGTQYILEALVYLSMSDDQTISFSKELYPYIAAKYDTNKNNVERNIRLAIEKVWTEKEIEKLRLIYPFEWNSKTGRPTNAEFLHNMKLKLFDRNRIL